ncbi:MAG: FecR domain-containing protein [Bacteroidota bacterium]
MNPNTKILLDRYLNRETSIEEDRLVEKWLTENSIADPGWQQLNRSDKDQWLSGVFADIKTSIHKNEPKSLVKTPNHYLWYKLAGVAALLVLLFGIYLSRPWSDQDDLSTKTTVIAEAKAQKRQITLPDGTRVWLNAGSELKYEPDFNKKLRTVSLSGEGFFDVKHDAGRPFVIHTGEVTTTVLGTAFNVKENKTGQSVEVTVTRGRVSVTRGDKISILTPDQQVTVDLLSGNFSKKTIEAEKIIAWISNEMDFDDVTFESAAAQLEKHFQVKISFDNEKLKTCRFSGSTFKQDQLAKILNVICGFNNATWKQQSDGSITIYGQGCN